MTTLLLKHYLEVNNCTQSEFAELTGLAKQSVNYWLKPSKGPVYVDYNVITGVINQVHAENILFRTRSKWDADNH